MTYQIALCDDETAELEKTKKLLGDYEKRNPGSDFTIRCFENAGELLGLIRERNYAPDLVFMDIYMPGEKGEKIPLGMEAAKQLRDMGNDAKLLFLTTSREYALEAFDVEASSYLLKPVSKDKLFSILDRFVKDEEQVRKKYILLKGEGGVIKVPLKDIVYCEAQGKRQHIYLADGTELVQNMTMAKICEMICDFQAFVKVGASYIINLEHVDSLNAQETKMDNGKKIYPPRGAYRLLWEQYFDYYCGEE